MFSRFSRTTAGLKEIFLKVFKSLIRRENCFPPDFLSRLYLGQRQPSLRDAVVSFSGELSGLRVWGRELKEEELKGYSATEGCQVEETEFREGLLLDWGGGQRWEHSQVQGNPHNYYTYNYSTGISIPNAQR